MSRKHRRLDKPLSTRLPEPLYDALQQRADALGSSPARVVREAIARECAVPVDARSPDYVSAWLNGADVARGEA
jgi:predicted transcriptional regulator